MSCTGDTKETDVLNTLVNHVDQKYCRLRGCRFSTVKPEWFDISVQKTKSKLKHLHAVLRFKK